MPGTKVTGDDVLQLLWFMVVSSTERIARRYYTEPSRYSLMIFNCQMQLGFIIITVRSRRVNSAALQHSNVKLFVMGSLY